MEQKSHCNDSRGCQLVNLLTLELFSDNFAVRGLSPVVLNSSGYSLNFETVILLIRNLFDAFHFISPWFLCVLKGAIK